MRKFVVAFAALGLAVGMSTVAKAADIVYTINQSSTTPEVGGELSPLSDTITGTITTDGTLGFLNSSNILNYDLQLKDNLRPTFDVDLTSANSGIWIDTGNGLTASTADLSFDFSNAGAIFIIQGTTYGFSSGYQYFCFQATGGPCVAGETIVPDYYAVDGVAATGLTGTVSLNSGVPEPATWAIMALGVGMVGGGLRVRRRKSAAALAAA
jgi:hypothetical protein